MERHAGPEGALCFMCHKVSPGVTVQTVSRYRSPELAARIRELLGTDSSEAATCEWCEEKPPTQYCALCNYALCAECTVAVHKNSAKRNHSTFSLQDGRKPTGSAGGCHKCNQKGHEEYRAEFFCVQCQTTVCVYCLQVGHHRGHENISVADAAADVRQQLSRQVEEVIQIKNSIDAAGKELNRVTYHYEDTYDHVEQALTERFAYYQQQLLRKESEVREVLQGLRSQGDRVIAECRKETLLQMDKLNETIARGRHFQSSASDTDVIENRVALNTFQNLEAPCIQGGGFHFKDPGELNLGDVGVSLDISEIESANTVPKSLRAPVSAKSVSSDPMRREAGAGRTPIYTEKPSHTSAALPKAKLSFPEDREVKIHNLPEGQQFVCSETLSTPQIGMRAKESFMEGVHSWSVRITREFKGGIGLVCLGGTSEAQTGEALVWRPAKQLVEGRLGVPTELSRRHPIPRSGDTLHFTFDSERRVLKVAHNDTPRGVLVEHVPGWVAPCLIFTSGDSVTVLN